MKSVSLGWCTMVKHPQIRHSPNGVDIIIECPTCCMAWIVKGGTGEEIRLAGSEYERRLCEQKLLQS